MNNVVLIGRLTRDPEISYIQGSGTCIARFTIAINREYRKKDGTRDTDFIPVEVMGAVAENCGKYISKGRLVGIQGSIRVDSYEAKDGSGKRTFTKVQARSVQFLESSNAQNNNFGAGAQGGAPNFQESTPDFNQASFDPNGFEAITDDDMPF